MSDQVLQVGETIVEVYRALRDTQEGGYGCISVGFTAKLVGCPWGIPCLILQKYTPDSTHVVDWGELIIDTHGTFEEEPVRIMDSRDQVLQLKTVRLVKVLWQRRGVEEATWERKDTMHATYPFLFKDEGTLFSHLVLK